MKYDAIVIGGGVSGLTAALIIARQGRSVALVERDKRLAPVLRGFRRGAVRFDTGLHYTGGLGEDGALTHYLRYLKVLEGLDIEPFDCNAFDEVRFLDGQDHEPFLYPWGFDRLRDALSQRFPAEHKAIEQYLTMVRAICQGSSYLNVHREPTHDGLLGNGDGRSVDEVLNSLTDNALLKGVLAAHSCLHGISPARADFSLHSLVAGSYYDGAYGIHGGGEALAANFKAAVTAAGVDCHTGCSASTVELDSEGHVQAVVLDNGTRLQGRICVVTTHPAFLLDALPEKAFRARYRQRLADMQDTPSAYMLFGSLRNTPEPLSSRNVLIYRTTNISENFIISPDPMENPLFLSRCGQGEGLVAVSSGLWKEHEQWAHSTRNTRPEEYLAFKQHKHEQALDALFSSMPALRDAYEPLEFATPLSMRDYGCWPSGGLYGAEHSVDRHPVLPVTKVGGLFLAGQSVVAPGVLGAVISAFVACGLMFGHAKLRKDVLESV